MFLILFLEAGENENIVKVDYIEDVNVATKRRVDIGLKGSRGIGQTKGYHKVFKVAVSRAKGYLPLVSFSYTDPVVGVSEVDFREDDGAVKPVEKLVNERERVAVLNREGI